MIQDDVTRNAVLNRLLQAGWITSAKALKKDDAPNQIHMQIAWTPAGITNMRTLHHLLQVELGFEAQRRGGEFDCLHSLLRSCISEHGPGDPPDDATRVRA
jgi:hypothetical protein